MIRSTLAGFGALLAALLFASTAAGANPQVRTITVFVELDSSRFEVQLAEAAVKLRQAQELFAQAGYSVQTLRVVTQPFMRYVDDMSESEALALLLRIEELARRNGVGVNIGPAVINDSSDARSLALLAAVQRRGTSLSSSMIVASEAGVHWNAVRAAARHVREVAVGSPRSQGTFNFAALAMMSPGSPFFPGAYHFNQGGRFSIGLESANVVMAVLARNRGNLAAATTALTADLSRHALEVRRVAADIERRTGWKYWGLDPTPAPLKDISIGAAIESYLAAPFGSPGTMTAAYAITEAVRSVPGPRVGYSGLMLPVLEDARIAQRWSEGRIAISSLLAYSAVCGTGLDAIPLPGDVSEEQLARIIGDVAVLAYKWRKPLTARLQPVHGRVAGQWTDFDSPYLVNARLHALP